MRINRQWLAAGIGGMFFLLPPASARRSVPHRVEPKATIDSPGFAIRSVVLNDGAILACYQKSGSGPTLVLVPETHGDRTQFFERTFLAGLPSQLPLLIVESRGQGRSWPPPAPGQATVEHYADDVLAVVKEMGLREWIACGHSLGGMVALEIGGRRPAGLLAVIALEGWVHHDVQREAFPEAPRSEKERVEAGRQRVERYQSQRWTDAEFERLGKAWSRWENGAASLSALQVPLLSVWGDRDLAEKPPRAKLRLPESSAVELVWIPGADHYVTDPPFAAITAKAIADFLRQHGLHGAAAN